MSTIDLHSTDGVWTTPVADAWTRPATPTVRDRIERLLPVLAGVWVWRPGWPKPTRVLLVGGIAAWNLLVMLPAHA